MAEKRRKPGAMPNPTGSINGEGVLPVPPYRLHGPAKPVGLQPDGRSPLNNLGNIGV
jgi:hypothetical protein